MPRRSLFLIFPIILGILFFIPETIFSQSCDGTSCTLVNPIGENNIQIILGRIVTAALGIIGSITFLIFIYGGFLWLTSAGNEERVKTGSNAMLYAAIGLFIIFASYAILNTVIVGLTGKESAVVPSTVTPTPAPAPAPAPKSKECYCDVDFEENKFMGPSIQSEISCLALNNTTSSAGAISNCEYL